MLQKVSRYPLGLLPVIIVMLLAAFPLMNDSRSILILLTKIFIFAVFAMSYDLLLGYTGIVSFGHAMFFGIGAYSVGIVMNQFGDSIGMLLLALLIGVLLAAVVSYVVGILSLRLQSHFYAMLTLAFAGLITVLADKWRSVTKGEDGFPFPVPELIRDRMFFYYAALVFMVVLFLLLRRFTRSPLGKVLQAIRENEQRTASLGYQVVHYKVIASVVAGVVAALSGAMYGMTLRFVNTSVFSMDMTLNALLMTIIGGIGTLYGGVIGATLIELAHELLTSLSKVHPIFERWIIFFGFLYILVVMVFPKGIAGTIKLWAQRKKPASARKRDDVSW
jgi:branched-chain amino acid transport system permease protein